MENFENKNRHKIQLYSIKVSRENLDQQAGKTYSNGQKVFPSIVKILQQEGMQY
jgi:hypothetical protein